MTATAIPSTTSKSSDTSPVSHPGGMILTALAMLQNGDNFMPARVAMDSCASHSMVTEKVAAQLKVKRSHTELTIQGAISEEGTIKQGRVKHSCELFVRPILPSNEGETIELHSQFFSVLSKACKHFVLVSRTPTVSFLGRITFQAHGIKKCRESHLCNTPAIRLWANSWLL